MSPNTWVNKVRNAVMQGDPSFNVRDVSFCSSHPNYDAAFKAAFKRDIKGVGRIQVDVILIILLFCI